MKALKNDFLNIDFDSFRVDQNMNISIKLIYLQEIKVFDLDCRLQ